MELAILLWSSRSFNSMRNKKYRGDLYWSEDLLYPFSSSEISFRKIWKFYTSKAEKMNNIDKNTKED